MVINDLNIHRAGITPHEAHALLVVDPNAVLARTSPAQGFQSVAWGRPQITQLDSIVEHLKFPLRDVLDVPEPPGALPLVKCLGVGAPE